MDSKSGKSATNFLRNTSGTAISMISRYMKAQDQSPNHGYIMIPYCLLNNDDNTAMPQDHQWPDPPFDSPMDMGVSARDPSPDREVEDCDRCRRFGKPCEWSDEYLACIPCHKGHRRCSRKLARRARYWTERTHDLCTTKAGKLDVPGLCLPCP